MLLLLATFLLPFVRHSQSFSLDDDHIVGMALGRRILRRLWPSPPPDDQLAFLGGRQNGGEGLPAAAVVARRVVAHAYDQPASRLLIRLAAFSRRPVAGSFGDGGGQRLAGDAPEGETVHDFGRNSMRRLENGEQVFYAWLSRYASGYLVNVPNVNAFKGH